MPENPHLLSWLLVGHLVGDYLLQTAWMADRKAEQWLPLLVHAAVYTLCVWLSSLPAGGLGPRGLALVFAAHLVVDRRRAVAWWVRNVCRAERVPGMFLAVDQSWHALVLALAVLV
jgi:hypothetical protein